MESANDDVDPKHVPGTSDAGVRGVGAAPSARDLVVAAVLALVAGGVSFAGSWVFGDNLLVPNSSYYDSDYHRYYENMTSRESNHTGTRKHPLISLVGFSISSVMRKVGVAPPMSVRLTIALMAAMGGACAYLLPRSLGCRSVDSTLLAALVTTSTAFIFFTAIPESYAFGYVTILSCLILASVCERRPASETWHVLAILASSAMTVTNGMFGVVPAFLNLPWRRALQVNLNALAIMVILWGAQKELFPSADFFLGSKKDQAFLFNKQSGGPWPISRSMFLYTMVAPPPKIGEHPYAPDKPCLLFQQSPIRSMGLPGIVAIGLWSSLLLIGAGSALFMRGMPRFRVALGLCLLGQLAIHQVFGAETILYSLHFLPLLLGFVALGFLGRARPLALILTLTLIPFAALNNVHVFMESVRAIRPLAAAYQGQ